MKHCRAIIVLTLALSSASYGQDSPLGSNIQGLLRYALNGSPEYAGMRS